MQACRQAYLWRSRSIRIHWCPKQAPCARRPAHVLLGLRLHLLLTRMCRRLVKLMWLTKAGSAHPSLCPRTAAVHSSAKAFLRAKVFVRPVTILAGSPSCCCITLF